jgi:hypothetical protein
MEQTKKNVEEEAEQASAKYEPMGSVAAAVPRDSGSALSADDNCPPENAPDHEGGHGTIDAGDEAHVADRPGKHIRKPFEGDHATIDAGDEAHAADQPGKHTQRPVKH